MAGLGRFLFWVLPCLPALGCASLGQKTPYSKKIEIRLKGQPGSVSETRYHSSARTQKFVGSQLVRDKVERVDFVVNQVVSKYDPAEKTLWYTVRTISKDGAGDLRDLSFPELHESIEYVIRTDSAQVLKAGAFSPQSVFFVPTLPMPLREVQVGDTWLMEHDWISAHNQVPLRLKLVAILKEIVRCSDHWCADLELSGGLELVQFPVKATVRFESRVWGRVLFDIERGDILWSEIRNRENLISPDERTLVDSCMLSELKISSRYRTASDCQPEEIAVSQSPRF